jgi:hypothetical protein
VARKSAEYTHFKLRIRRKLRDQIEREATKNRRSSTAEVIERLERSFDQDATAHLVQDAAREAAERAVGSWTVKLTKTPEFLEALKQAKWETPAPGALTEESPKARIERAAKLASSLVDDLERRKPRDRSDEIEPRLEKGKDRE